MPVKIYSKRIGINRCYVIKADGCIMVDTGPPKSGKVIEKWLGEILLDPQKIRLTVLTHGHADHVGSALRVKNFTGARIALHEEDTYMIENSQTVWPAAASTWDHIARYLFRPLASVLRFDSFKTDVIIGDEGLSLEEYGIQGKVISTPGHTPGSVSVLLETGDAFEGCMPITSFRSDLGRNFLSSRRIYPD